ncbi:MAG: hypothetical protein IPF47_14520 [Gemmatimonadetes bacterium]|nr:hypothetical protein [Gemmatimonadota bacterium]
MASSVIERLQVDIQSNAAQLQAEMAKGETAVRRLSRATAESATLAQANGQRYAQAGVQIASAFENMARAGKVGGDALKQVIVQGSNMAFSSARKGRSSAPSASASSR